MNSKVKSDIDKKNNFEKLKERFSPKTNIEEVKITDQDEQEVFEENLDKITAGHLIIDDENER